jgi:hypothetical protein
VEAVPPDGRAVRWQESVRLHESSELADMAGTAGLFWDGSWPGLRGPEDEQGRLVAWMRRPVGNEGRSR